MSLLSDIQGRPHTVRALIRTMQQLGGEIADDELESWFLPGVFSTGDANKSLTRVKQTVGCARSLGWLESEEGSHRLSDPNLPTDPDEILDHLHQTLCETDKAEDHRILEVYACMVLLVEREGSTSLLEEWTNTMLAERIDQSLPGREASETNLFNSTKLSSWREWIAAIGLGFDSQTLGMLLPNAAPRLLREVAHISAELEADGEIAADVFIEAIARRMPYLDGGEILQRVAQQMKQPPTEDQLSIVLSRALLELEDDGVIEIVSRGDVADRAVRMPALDGGRQKWVVGFVLKEFDAA